MNKEQVERTMTNSCVASAWLADKTIQIRLVLNSDSSWCDYTGTHPQFDSKDYEWRIKPEPQYRAWRAEEVPLGAWIKGKHQLTGTTILASFFSTITVALASNIGEIGFQEALDDWVHSQDQGKTWLPCGVEK